MRWRWNAVMFAWRTWLPILALLLAGCRPDASRVAELDAAGAAELRANVTGHPRLIHFWATTCPPCVAEFPQLATLAGEIKAKGVEFITISFDPAGDTAKVDAFLARHDPSGNGRHFLWNGGKASQVSEAIDPDWTGAIPHSLVVAPGGQIVWRHVGPADPDEVRRVLTKTPAPLETPK